MGLSLAKKLGLVIFGLLLLPAFSGCGMILGIPDVNVLKTKYPTVLYNKVSEDSDKPEAVVILQKTKPAHWTDFSAVSRDAWGAILVSEDWAFYQHKGYDPKQIEEALKEAVEDGHRLRGASTITQQVARNVFLDQDRNLMRKVKELFIAVRMEKALTKKKILEIYLNIAEFGEGLYGIGPAARFYFGKAPADLTAKEGAFLAMLLPSPKRYSQSFRAKKLTEYARDTINSILDKMVQAKYLNESQRDALDAVPLSFETVSSPTPSPSPQDMP